MSLINCPECDKEVSDQAQMCPHCGRDYPRLSDGSLGATNITLKIFQITGLIICLVGVYSVYSYFSVT